LKNLLGQKSKISFKNQYLIKFNILNSLHSVSKKSVSHSESSIRIVLNNKLIKNYTFDPIIVRAIVSLLAIHHMHWMNLEYEFIFEEIRHLAANCHYY